MSAAASLLLLMATLVCVVFLLALAVGLSVDRPPRRHDNPFTWRDE